MRGLFAKFGLASLLLLEMTTGHAFGVARRNNNSRTIGYSMPTASEARSYGDRPLRHIGDTGPHSSRSSKEVRRETYFHDSRADRLH
jgi:hypothetical protein